MSGLYFLSHNQNQYVLLEVESRSFACKFLYPSLRLLLYTLTLHEIIVFDFNSKMQFKELRGKNEWTQKI